MNWRTPFRSACTGTRRQTGVSIIVASGIADKIGSERIKMDRFLLIYWGIAIFASGNEAPGLRMRGSYNKAREYVRMFNL